MPQKPQHRTHTLLILVTLWGERTKFLLRSICGCTYSVVKLPLRELLAISEKAVYLAVEIMLRRSYSPKDFGAIDASALRIT